jgi:hypothetical protein
MIKKKLQVFVSSTYTDLKEERQAAVEAILKSGHIPAGMELFTAGNQSQLDTIKRWIDESDVYMLILGGRYGSVEPNTGLSYTELEYDYAGSKDIPHFAVVITDGALDAAVKIRGKEVLEQDHPDRLKTFRAKVLAKISTFFGDKKDIKLAVHETLSDFLLRHNFTGWVSGADIQDTKPLMNEIARLTEEKNQLVDKLRKAEQAKPKQKSSSNQEEFCELVKLFTETQIETRVFNDAGDNKPKQFSLIKAIDVLQDQLVMGPTNSVEADEIDQFLFFSVCPKLEIHGLAGKEKVPSVQWRRYSLTPRGLEFVAFLNKLVKKNLADPKK